MSNGWGLLAQKSEIADALKIVAKQSAFMLDKRSRLIEPHPTAKDKLVFNGGSQIPITIGDKIYLASGNVVIDTSTDLDTGAIQAGKDYYVYAVDDGSLDFLLSLNSTYPTGYDADTSRKIGGIHTLCADVGVIAGHTLSGYLAGEILPQSVWDLKHRPISEPEGMVYDPKIRKWVDIYLASGSGASTASVYSGTITDNRNWMDFVDDGLAVSKRLLSDFEFQSIAAGSNEETNITGSSDPVTTGGHVDAAGRRMISDVGCEDCAGAMQQWLLDQSYRADGTTWVWYNLPGAKGSMYEQGTYGDVKLLAGGYWGLGTYCGSRSRYADNARWSTGTGIGGRFVAEAL